MKPLIGSAKIIEHLLEMDSRQVYTQTEPVDVHNPKSDAPCEQGDQMLPNLGEHLHLLDDRSKPVRGSEPLANSPALQALIDLSTHPSSGSSSESLKCLIEYNKVFGRILY